MTSITTTITYDVRGEGWSRACGSSFETAIRVAEDMHGFGNADIEILETTVRVMVFPRCCMAKGCGQMIAFTERWCAMHDPRE